MNYVVKGVRSTLKPLGAKIYLQDPLIAAQTPALGIDEIELEGEAVLGPGPSTSRVVVVDYNADLDVVFEPAAPLANESGFNIGRIRDEVENLKFHQVNAWAIVTRTLNILEYESIFGRRIPWAFGSGRITIIPHAGYWENAYYDRSTGALHFFYFEGRDGPVYTCLSHDIITHELGHAVLDGLKPHYNEVSSPATAGFHEFFGDAVALASALTHRRIVVSVAGSDDAVRRENPVTKIASQFGAALSQDHYGELGRDYLRSARNTKKMSDLDGVYEEHEYSEVLTAAYYDFLEIAYDSMLGLVLREDGAVQEHGGHRVRALMRASDLTARMMIRAIDYCPPVDVRFDDFARAAIRSDELAYPTDASGYRSLLKDVFVNREIVSSRADLDNVRTELRNDDLRDLDVEVLGASETDAYDFVNANRAALRVPPEVNLRVINVYRTAKLSANGYRPPREIIVEFVWSADVPLKGAEYGQFDGSTVPLWCGGTLVFSRDGNLLHYEVKEDLPQRRDDLREYVKHLIKRRAISFSTGERGFGSSDRGGSVIGHVASGRVRLERSAAFRHVGRLR